MAIGARYLQKQYGLEKILIVDWDVHHGNGTQHFFEEDPSVFYFSAHQFPYYPGTGRMSETGTGVGTGRTLNLPFPGGASEAEYLQAFQKVFLPAAIILASSLQVKNFYHKYHETLSEAAFVLAQSSSSGGSRILRNFGIHKETSYLERTGASA